MSLDTTIADLSFSDHVAQLLDCSGPDWADALALRRQSHFADCFDGVMARGDYEAAREQPGYREPGEMSLEEFRDDPHAQIVGWRSNSRLDALAVLKIVRLRPSDRTTLLVERLFLSMPVDGALCRQIADALWVYAQKNGCEVIHVSVLRHLTPLLPELQARGGRAVVSEIQCLL